MTLSTRQRRALYNAELEAAAEDGLEFPLCNICQCSVFPGQAWDESHMPVARAFGGQKTGIAHRTCNRHHGAKVVTPAVAKSNRVRDKHRGIRRSSRPIPGWQKFDGTPVRNPRLNR